MEQPLSFPYECDRARLGAELASRFAPLSPDAERDAWLARYATAPHGFWATRLSQAILPFSTAYQVHGWLGMYPMHLLSAEAWRELLGAGPFDHLLDVGAGAGYVTEGARALFRRITCTETSSAMLRRLKGRGFDTHAGDLTLLPERAFDVVSCFNVIDRTARPLTLLRAVASRAKQDGRVLISVPLPLSPHVHVAGGTIAPDERLPLDAHDWESAARVVTEQVIGPAGLTVQRLARVPYLSRGDANRTLYVLDAGVWLCRLAG